MNVSIVAGTDEKLDALERRIHAQGHEIKSKLIRENDVSLKKIMEAAMSEVVVIDGLSKQASADFLAIEKYTNSNPSIEVMLINDNREADVMVAAMQSGIREILIAPASDKDFNEAFHRIDHRRRSIGIDAKSKARKIAFLSCKGGSGATFLATNLAYILADELGKNTAFLDLDIRCGDAAYHMASGPSRSDITEITRQIDRLDSKLLASSILNIAPNFDLLSAPEIPDPEYAITPLQLEKLIDIVSENYEVVVLDLEHVYDPLTAHALEIVDVVYLVMQNVLPYLRDAKRVVTRCRTLGLEEQKIRLIVNRYEKNDGIDVPLIEQVVGIKVSYTIESSTQDVTKAINTGVAITKVNKKNPVALSLRDIAKQFGPNLYASQQSWFSKLIGY